MDRLGNKGKPLIEEVESWRVSNAAIEKLLGAAASAKERRRLESEVPEKRARPKAKAGRI
jgi:hypothetical protein